MSWRNIIKHADGTTTELTHRTSAGDAKGWNESLAREKGCEVRLEHIDDGPYSPTGVVTHVQTVNGATRGKW